LTEFDDRLSAFLGNALGQRVAEEIHIQARKASMEKVEKADEETVKQA